LEKSVLGLLDYHGLDHVHAMNLLSNADTFIMEGN
jgi:hypothetical protein